MLHRMWFSKFKDFVDSAPNPDGGGKLLPPGAWEYYTGHEPSYCRTEKTWVLDVDDIYCPMHIKADHWVALYISLPRRHIVIWDSLYKHARDIEITKAVTPIAVILPHLLRECNASDKHRFSLDPFSHERVKQGVPQNIQSGDCGVFALKYIECHALGLPFPPSTLKDSNMDVVREKLAAEIFDETNLCGKEKMEKWDVLDLYEPR